MNTTLVCMVAALSATPFGDPWQPTGIESRWDSGTSAWTAAIRSQNQQSQSYQDYEELPTPNSGQTAPPTYAAPQGGGFVWPFSSGPPNYDPFLGQPGNGTPYGGSPGVYSYGANGPQPYRFGWSQRYNVGVLPNEHTERGLGDFGIFEFDAEWQYTQPWVLGLIKSVRQEFNLRTWDGPTGSPSVPTVALPGQVFRFGWDVELATPANGPWAFQVAFNPSLNTDFEQGLSSDAWNFDGRGMVFLRTSPQWMYVFGAGFWDRVHDRVIPYAGVVWTPDDRWEWRILFPRSRVSYFLGSPWGFSTWLYARGEYHVEAYEIQLETTGAREKFELSDWRILFGARADNGWASLFYELGVVFGRHTEFLHDTPSFDIGTGFITRAGLQF